MAKTEKMRFQKGDCLAIGLVLLLAVSVALCFLPRNRQQGIYAEIYQNGEKIKTIPLDEAQSIVVTGTYRNEITIADGRIAITYSNCPGEDCVHSGWISGPGRSIVCLPNKLEIRISGQENDVDFVVR